MQHHQKFMILFIFLSLQAHAKERTDKVWMTSKKILSYCLKPNDGDHLKMEYPMIDFNCAPVKKQPMLKLLSPPVGNGDRLFHSDAQVSKTLRMEFYAYLPEKKFMKKSLPLILALHGTVMRGDRISKLRQRGMPAKLAKDKSFPFVVVAPQLSSNRTWKPEQVISLLDHALKFLPIDRKKVYMTGYSHGGFGTWRTIAKYPERFAAAAPSVEEAIPLRPVDWLINQYGLFMVKEI